MAKNQRANSYKPYKGKKKLHIDRKTSRRIPGCVTAGPPPQPLYPENGVLIGKAASTEVARERDENVGPLLGKTHTARILERMGQ